MDSGDDPKTYVPPFEVYPTSIISGTNKDKIYTQTIGVRTNSQHYALLKELFTCLFQHPPAEVSHIRFSLSGISTLIGLENYQKLILNNNKHLSNIATIPITGFNQCVLDLKIHITNNADPNKHLSIQQIIQSLPWCSHIEHTQMDNKILIVTSRGQLFNVHQWLDQNLEPLFKKHLTKNPKFYEIQGNIIPRCTDWILTTSATDDYAKKLVSTLPQFSDSDKKKYATAPS